MSPRPLLITGGAGYIGSHTVKHLLAQGERIVVLDNLVFGHEDALPPGVTSVPYTHLTLATNRAA